MITPIIIAGTVITIAAVTVLPMAPNAALIIRNHLPSLPAPSPPSEPLDEWTLLPRERHMMAALVLLHEAPQ